MKAIHGNGKVERVTIFNSKTKEEETLEMDAIIPLLGFHSDLGAIKEWGLDTEKADIKVDSGDGHQRARHLRRGGHHHLSRQAQADRDRRGEACIAVNNAVHSINPKAKVNPGHSSNLAIFGQKDD